jgi:signal transduction histidine kinase
MTIAMSIPDRLSRLLRRLGRPRTTVSGRLTALYGSLFFASGVVLLVITYLLVEHTFPVVDQKSVGLGGSQVNGAIPGRAVNPAAAAAAAALSNQLRNQDLHHLLVDSSIALAIMVVISIALGWLVAGRVLRPLRTITATTRQISEDSLHQRLALAGPADELKDLGDTIDGLLGRLDDAFEAQRRFAANASHELRTPLTVGRTLLEMVLSDPAATIDTYQTVCQDVLEASQQQERLIDALLTLARSQRGLDRRHTLDLAAITTHAAHAHQSVADSRQVRLDVSAQTAPITGDSLLIERLVSNLLDNALRYNHPGGNIQVTVDARAGKPTLTVTNTGQLVPPKQLERIVQPFQRLATERAVNSDGVGLGLCIVQAITTAHGAHLDLQPASNGGLHAEVTFSPTYPTSEKNSATSMMR